MYGYLIRLITLKYDFFLHIKCLYKTFYGIYKSFGMFIHSFHIYNNAVSPQGNNIRLWE